MKYRVRPPSPEILALCFARRRIVRYIERDGQRLALVARGVPDMVISKGVKPSKALLAKLQAKYLMHVGGVPGTYRDAAGRTFLAIEDVGPKVGAA